MNQFQKTLKQIAERKERLERGGINTIPFPFPALNKFVPGIMPETQIGLTTVSGAGKSLFATNIYVQHPFNFWLENRNTMDIDIKIFFFCLEDSKDLTMKRMIIRALYEQLGIRVPMFKINSYFKEDKLDDTTLRAIESLDPYFEEFLSKVEFIDDLTTPGQIYFKVKEWLERPENGEIVDEKGRPLDKREQKEAHEAFQKTYYKSKHKNRFVINIIDNMQNVEPGPDDGTKWNALDKLCRKLLRNQLCNKYGCTNLIIAQQEKSKEKTQYTGDGEIVASKYLPSKDAISEYKNVTDTCHVLFGLFYPHMYNIESYPEPSRGYPYDIKRLEDYYRNLHILKSNFAEPNLNTSLLFDGVTGIISELPPASDKEKMNEVYRYVDDMIMLKKGIKPLKMG